MSEFTERPEEVIFRLERAPRDRRPAITAGTSIVLHLVLLGSLYLSQRALERQPDKVEPSLPLIFEELTQPSVPPPKPRVPLNLQQPPSPPPAPAAPAATEGQLFGFNSNGAVKGTPERPPGPETGRFGPEEPGEKGKGRQDGGAPEEREKGAPPPRPLEPEREPEAETTPPRDTADGGAFGEPLPLPPGDDLPPRRQGPTPGGRSPSFRVPPSNVPPEGGRRGARGSGMDFDIGGGGGAFGDLQFESTDYNWSEYSSKVYWAVYRAWLRELYGRTARFERDQSMRRLPNLDGEVRIRVTLHRRAAIETEILSPSVVPTLDEASEAALHRAVLPDLPADFPRDSERVTWRFRIEGFESAQQLQRNLDIAQMRGVF